MGVYHFSGLGLSPGGLTVPLTTIYTYLASSIKGSEIAREFFIYSGETGEHNGSSEKIHGGIEGIVVFTSKEVINCDIEINSRYISKWFPEVRKSDCMMDILKKYFKNLVDHLNEILDDEGPLRYPVIYAVQVNHKSFEDVFQKAFKAYMELKRKEVWVNMVGGTNQINSALLIAGSLSSSPVKYYYVFQNDERFIDPDFIDKPSPNNIKYLAVDIHNNIYELPIFRLDFRGFIKELIEKFDSENTIHKNDLVECMSRYGLSKKDIPKLIGARIISKDKFDNFVIGAMLEKITSLVGKDYGRGGNLSEWIREEKERGTLRVIKID